MWILKNSKESLEHLKSPNLNHITGIESYDFLDPLHYHSSPETLKQTRNYHPELFHSQKWKLQIQNFGLSCEGLFFVMEHSDYKIKYTEDEIINMLDFLVDNIFAVFGGKAASAYFGTFGPLFSIFETTLFG